MFDNDTAAAAAQELGPLFFLIASVVSVTGILVWLVLWLA